MKEPDSTIFMVEDWGKVPVEAPRRVYFGPLVGVAQRGTIKQMALRSRKLIGNTAMDPELSLIMANMGQARPGTLVLDPFVGTGSMLFTAAYFGSMVLGTDLNKTLLHGVGKTSRSSSKHQKLTSKFKGKEENMAATMSQYGLAGRFVGVLASDQGNPPWKGCQPHGMFDSIITDPPYGIREGARRAMVLPPKGASSGGGKESRTGGDVKTVPRDSVESATTVQAAAAAAADTGVAADAGAGAGAETETERKYPQRGARYERDAVFDELLDFAAETLLMGGRLVYWLPVIQDEYNHDQVPRHPCLEIIANCEQPLSGKLARRLITMAKVAPWDPTAKATSAKPLESHAGSFREKIFESRESKNAAKAAAAAAAAAERGGSSTAAAASAGGNAGDGGGGGGEGDAGASDDGAWAAAIQARLDAATAELTSMLSDVDQGAMEQLAQEQAGTNNELASLSSRLMTPHARSVAEKDAEDQKTVAEARAKIAAMLAAKGAGGGTGE